MTRFHDLYLAVSARDCARLRQLVRRGADINCRDSWKRTVLHHAARYILADGIKDVIDTLVDLGADVNAGDIERRTPLHCHLAMNCNSANAGVTASAIAFLILLGADINAKFDDKVTSLQRAIQLNNIGGIDTLLKLGVDVNAKQLTNCTAIQFALDKTGKTLLEHLVKLGADINSTVTILPPLFQAVDLGRLDIVKLLVQHGANVNSWRQDATVVFTAVARRTPFILKSLGQLGADLNTKMTCSSIVNESVKVGRVDILEYVVRCGADIFRPLGAEPLHQITALGIAVSRDLHEMVDCLLKNGADVNVRYDADISPFVTAMRLGDIDMVRALANLAPCPIDTDFRRENITVLYNTLEKDPKVLKKLLRHGGDVNTRYDFCVRLVHKAVAQGNESILRVLAELGVNLNCGKVEGVGLIHNIVGMLDSEQAERQMAFIRVLVEAGVDLNQCYHEHVRPLHDAVRLGDLGMVQILGELKVDVIAAKTESTPLFLAIGKGRTDIVRYFAENGVDVNRKITAGVTPLHDAVWQGDADIARVLIINGGDTESRKCTITAPSYSISTGNNDMVKCLLECGSEIDAQSTYNISALHDAVEKSDLGMIDVLTDGRLPANLKKTVVTPLRCSIQDDRSDITETLVKYGADMNCLQDIAMTPLDMALDQGKVECALLLMIKDVEVCRDTVGASPLQLACKFGHVDLARLLIIDGSDVHKLDNTGNKPMERLLLSNIADYHVLQEAAMAAKVAEQVPASSVSTSGCQDMRTSLHTPGIGDVKYISSPSAAEISQRVNHLLTSIIQQCKPFLWKKLHPIGSSAEGTREGLPNEMDFLLRVQLANDDEMTTEDLGNGYAKYDLKILEHMDNFQLTTKGLCDRNLIPKIIFGSAGFHGYFIEKALRQDFVGLKNTVHHDERVSHDGLDSLWIIDTARKACSVLTLKWKDDRTAFYIPVDIVPSVHIDNWPEGATTRTWLMGEKELRSRGYVLVPKPPHVKGDLAKECTEEELITLWKISFPHLETEHMQRLEQRVKDVYITAKCLRNPDVCRIMITDGGSLPRNVSKYVTSYMLKMCFFKNVEYFLQHDDLCLEEMVCKVYDDLMLFLSKNFIPLFFLPKVSALSGIDIDVPKCHKVAKIMARFVRALYLRDSLGDIADGGDDLVMTVYQRNPGLVYRVYDISNEDV